MCKNVRNSNDSSSLKTKGMKAGGFLEVEDIKALGKDMKEIRDTIRELYSKKIDLKIKESNITVRSEENTYLVIYNLLTSLIEIQSSGIKAGIKIAKSKGKRIGKKKLSLENLPYVFLSNYNSYKNGNMTKVSFSKLCGCSRPTLDKWIKCYEENSR